MDNMTDKEAIGCLAIALFFVLSIVVSIAVHAQSVREGGQVAWAASMRFAAL